MSNQFGQDVGVATGFLAAATAAMVLFAAIGVGVAWYCAGLQADVYRRSGIEMSTWEVFMGAKPPERVIHLKN